MKKRTTVKILSFSLALYAALGGYIFKYYNEASTFKRELHYDYSEALISLNDSLENLSYSLEKSMYATSSSVLSVLASEIMHEAATAKSSLARIPLNNNVFSNINKFLSQSGGFSLMLSKKASEGSLLTEAETSSIKTLSDIAYKLSFAINEGESNYNYEEAWSKIGLSENEEESLLSLMQDTEESLQGYPTLIYDGPYSDHILEKEPELTKTLTDKTEQEAKAVAAKALNVNEDQLVFSGTEEGKMPAYKFSFKNGEVSVTKKGAVILYFLKSREINNETLSYEEAVNFAERYLKEHADYNFKSSYYYVENGICTVNFSFIENETIMYTDLIKVSVALDNGEILGVEARGFIANHKNRTLPTPKVTINEAKKSLPKDTEIINTTTALIPTNSQKEELCYEFTLKGKEDREILIYINTQTGKEEDVLILLKSDGGSLTK